MNYIVDPMFFYWTNVCNNLTMLFTLIGTLLAIAASAYVLCCIVDLISINWRIATPLIIVTATCLLLSVFIPDKRTLITMEVAKHVTYESVDTVVEATQNAADYILNGLKESKE